MADYRKNPSTTNEGAGIARRAWDEWSRVVNKAGEPLVLAVAKRLSASMTVDMFGFWLMWHLEGGFEGMERLGMNQATIYRKVKRFRDTMGVHPDEYEMPGVSVDLEAYLRAAE